MEDVERKKSWQKVAKAIGACEGKLGCDECVQKVHALMPLMSEETIRWSLKWSAFDKTMADMFDVVKQLERKLSEKKQGEQHIVELFKRVFAACKVGNERIVVELDRGNKGFALYGYYERKIVITRNGIGSMSKYDTRVSYLNNFREFVQLKHREGEVLAEIRKNQKAQMLGIDMRDMLSMLPNAIEICEERVVLTLTTSVICMDEEKAYEANYVMIDSRGTDVRMKLVSIEEGKQKKVPLEKVSSWLSKKSLEEFTALKGIAEEYVLEEATELNDDGERFLLTKLVKLGDEKFAILEVPEHARTFDVGKATDADEWLMLLQLEPQLPLLLVQAQEKFHEYSTKYVLLDEQIRTRFAKQLLAGAL